MRFLQGEGTSRHLFPILYNISNIAHSLHICLGGKIAEHECPVSAWRVAAAIQSVDLHNIVGRQLSNFCALCGNIILCYKCS